MVRLMPGEQTFRPLIYRHDGFVAGPVEPTRFSASYYSPLSSMPVNGNNASPNYLKGPYCDHAALRSSCILATRKKSRRRIMAAQRRQGACLCCRTRKVRCDRGWPQCSPYQKRGFAYERSPEQPRVLWLRPRTWIVFQTEGSEEVFIQRYADQLNSYLSICRLIDGSDRAPACQ